jgi:FtsZ-interacting cell division protein ZipA
MQMNWRLLTAINGAIALITIAAVIFGLTHSRTEKVRAQRAPQSVAGKKQGLDSSEKNVVQHLDYFSQARVDNMGAVPAAELTQLMTRADPDQIAALAQKFNDVSVDAHTMGGLGVFFQAWDRA